ncbi:MAG TPA: AMP-binding protein, partial [Acidimicrobiia bacterium]|nr:AMP-binding protein [Acidimicrobiia bacterium]
GLVELNVAPGEVVSFQLPNWWQVAALHLACVRIGAVANPIITILRRREVSFILDRVASRVCIVPGEFRGFDHAAMLAELRAELPELRHAFVCGGTGDPPGGLERFEPFFCDTRWEDKHPAAELDARRPGTGDPAQIMFTSGTTGEPKGVVHSHHTMDMGLRAVSEPLGLGADDVVLMFSPLGHQTGYLYGMCMPLKYGMKLVLQDAWDPATMLRLVGDERVTWTMGTTTFVLDACAEAARTPWADLSSLRYFTCGGAPIPPKAVTAARSRLGTSLVAVWGMTEVGVCTTTRPEDADEVVCSSDGTPVDWAELRIVDGDGADVPDGVEGRLLVRTPSQHLTYHGRPDLYAAAFPEGVEAGWFDTGDLARRSPGGDGSIRITGRSKDLIIRGGENIPVAEVEAGLISHPLVHEVAVIAAPDERLGEKVCAVVVPAGDEAPTLPELRDHLLGLGMAKPYWPELLLVKDSLPKTASGKTQKFALREELARA